MDKYGLIPGIYTFSMAKRRVSTGKRVVMVIFKGDRPVGFLLWHPGAKSICFDGEYFMSADLLDFIRPYMDKKRFYMAWKIHKLLDKTTR